VTLPKWKINLDGITLEMMVTELVAVYGWEDLGKRIRINCFSKDPSVKSSLTFLRRTPWARQKVEGLYLHMRRVQMTKQAKEAEKAAKVGKKPGGAPTDGEKRETGPK
jgi:uncharacterized protein (DUF2132 family)